MQAITNEVIRHALFRQADLSVKHWINKQQQEAGELYAKLTTLNAPIYRSIKIADIMSRLNELAYAQPFPQLEG